MTTTPTAISGYSAATGDPAPAVNEPRCIRAKPTRGLSHPRVHARSPTIHSEPRSLALQVARHVDVLDSRLREEQETSLKALEALLAGAAPAVP